MTGESCQYVCVYNNAQVTSGVLWEIVSGSSYAAINSTSGLLTILSGANNSDVIIRATYNGLTKTKDIVVTYESGTSSSSSTESHSTTNPDGSVTETTTTTTIITDGQGNTTTAVSETTIVIEEDGSRTETESTSTTNPDGSSSSSYSAVTYDENGDVSGSQTNQTTNNSDGSSNSTTTNYDENGTPTDKTSTSGDTSGNENTQNIEFDEHGNEVVTGYEIDTSNNPNSGETVSNLDTGMIVFDGRGFHMHLKFRARLTDNSGKIIFSAAQRTGTTKYAGFAFSIRQAYTTSDAQLWVSAGKNSSWYAGGILGAKIHTYALKVPRASSSSITEYTVDAIYTPEYTGTRGHFYVDYSPYTKNSNNEPPLDSKNDTYIPESLDNATFTIGGNGISDTYNMTGLEVVEFSVTKV